MAFLKRDEFLALPLRHEDVSVRGGTLRVWELSAAKLIESQSEKKGVASTDRGLAFAAQCIGDEAGPFDPPYTVAELRKAAGLAVTKLVEAASRINRQTEGAREETLGNS
jgi:hypothetical protein